ncbi:MAG: sigma 54-interacting transcriptional regulator [Thermodesulfobacteriota bacterium]|nr:sigma 54-interacting transcriptional regulator [Thermodesulfobacteriota bacterium]
MASVYKELGNIKYLVKLFEMTFENALEAIVVVDGQGIVQYANQKYINFCEVGKDGIRGRHITEINKPSRIPVVIKTGKAEMGRIMKAKGQTLVVNRIPITDDNDNCIGVVGTTLFSDLSELKKMAQRLNVLETKVEFYKKELENIRAAKYTLKNIIGNCKVTTEIKKMAVKAAKTSFPILILGETGTGKELFAHAIHHASPRKYKDFIKINCASIPKELLETELFGYEPGAFTGAGKKAKLGKIELAHQGTLFLDEVGDIPPEIQTKLLLVLEEKEVERVGGLKPIKVDFRLITATHKDLNEIENFRSDLLYRIDVIRLNLPPLRERKEDIPILVKYLLEKINREQGAGSFTITSEALDLMKNYHWPGNIRELINTLENAIVVASHNKIESRDIKKFISSFRYTVGSSRLKEVCSQIEKETILNALQFNQGNMVKTSRLLGIQRSVLYDKLKKYNLLTFRDTMRKIHI